MYGMAYVYGATAKAGNGLVFTNHSVVRADQLTLRQAQEQQPRRLVARHFGVDVDDVLVHEGLAKLRRLDRPARGLNHRHDARSRLDGKGALRARPDRGQHRFG